MIRVGTITFDWDEEKSAINKKKHGISFEEAITIFFSIPLLVFHDPDHSTDEDRFIAFGFSAANRILAVVHCENESGNLVRVISARRATKKEQKKFLGE